MSKTGSKKLNELLEKEYSKRTNGHTRANS